MIQCKLNHILAQRKISQRELARRIKVSQMTLNRLCRNESKRINPDLTHRICKELGISLNELFDMN